MQWLKTFVAIIFIFPNTYAMDEKKAAVKEGSRLKAIAAIRSNDWHDAVYYCNYYKVCPLCYAYKSNFGETKPQARNHLEKCYAIYMAYSEEEKIERKRVNALGRLFKKDTAPAVHFIQIHGNCPLKCNQVQTYIKHADYVKHVCKCFEEATGYVIDYDSSLEENVSEKTIEDRREKSIQCPECLKPFSTQNQASSHYDTEHMMQLITGSE